jgi:hypothetical protein
VGVVDGGGGGERVCCQTPMLDLGVVVRSTDSADSVPA